MHTDLSNFEGSVLFLSKWSCFELKIFMSHCADFTQEELSLWKHLCNVWKLESADQQNSLDTTL